MRTAEIPAPAAALRGVAVDASPPLPDDTDQPAVEQVIEQLTHVEREMEGLRSEVDLLRKRDTTLNFYMQRLDEELRLAARLQQDFLPKRLPELGPARFHALWRPCGYVSGDLYDITRLDEEHIGFYIADAVGHGMPAALLTMFIKNAMVAKEINGWKYRLLEPGETLSRLNDALMAQNLAAGTFCTAWCGLLNVRTLELRYANAGHPSPILLRHDDAPSVLRADGPLLGVFENEVYPTASCTLQPGDRLVVFSDGVDVAFTDEEEGKSEAPWVRELAARQHLDGGNLLREITARLDDTLGSLTPRDDLTVVVAEVDRRS